MSRLLLVRHAQASFFAADYDQLSALGFEQARRLGQYWAALGQRLDALVTGPRRRQRQTAETVAEVLAAAPELWELPEFDEVRLDVIISSTWQPSRDVPAALHEKVAAYRQAAEPKEKLRAFQRLAEAVAVEWLHGRYVVPEAESWIEFSARVRRGLQKLRERTGRGKTVAVFTSAGPVAATLQHALHCPHAVALELVWQIRNASITELLFSDDRLSLAQFNGVPHLAEAGLITYR
jgi:broad specificity phosphatase PhoE